MSIALYRLSLPAGRPRLAIAFLLAQPCPWCESPMVSEVGPYRGGDAVPGSDKVLAGDGQSFVAHFAYGWCPSCQRPIHLVDIKLVRRPGLSEMDICREDTGEQVTEYACWRAGNGEWVALEMVECGYGTLYQHQFGPYRTDPDPSAAANQYGHPASDVYVWDHSLAVLKARMAEVCRVGL